MTLKQIGYSCVVKEKATRGWAYKVYDEMSELDLVTYKPVAAFERLASLVGEPKWRGTEWAIEAHWEELRQAKPYNCAGCSKPTHIRGDICCECVDKLN